MGLRPSSSIGHFLHLYLSSLVSQSGASWESVKATASCWLPNLSHHTFLARMTSTTRGIHAAGKPHIHRINVKRHARATLLYPGSQGTRYGGGMSVAPENSKLKTFHLEVKCHTERSFHPTNQAKCRACYVLSTYWLFPLPWDGKITKKTNFFPRTKVATDATSKSVKFTKDFEIKVLHSKTSRNHNKCFKNITSSHKLHNCMTTSKIEAKNALRLKPSLLQRYAAKTIVNKCGKSTKTK